MKPLTNRFFYIKLSIIIRARFYMLCIRVRKSQKCFFVLKTSGIEKNTFKPLSVFQCLFNKTVRLLIKNTYSSFSEMIIKTNYSKKLKILKYNSLKVMNYIFY